jgi:hypothetical protein
MVQQKLNTSEDEHGNRLQEKDNSIFKNQKKKQRLPVLLPSTYPYIFVLCFDSQRDTTLT